MGPFGRAPVDALQNLVTNLRKHCKNVTMFTGVNVVAFTMFTYVNVVNERCYVKKVFRKHCRKVTMFTCVNVVTFTLCEAGQFCTFTIPRSNSFSKPGPQTQIAAPSPSIVTMVETGLARWQVACSKFAIRNYVM